MRYSVYYPNTYDRDTLLARQSPVPSQHGPMANLPYSPDLPLGVSPQPDTTPGYAPANGYTAYVWDSRPAMSQDFFQCVTLVQDSPIPGFTVPLGYTGILRSVSVNIYNNNSTATGAIMDVHGHPFNDPTFTASIDVDGVPQIGFTGIDLTEAAFGTAEIPCFVLASEGQTFTLGLDLVNLGPPFANWFITFYGQLLVSTGRALTLECTNEYPLPVTMADATDANLGV